MGGMLYRTLHPSFFFFSHQITVETPLPPPPFLPPNMFVLLVASEQYGAKHNIEVGFPAVPSMAELVGHLEATLQIEHRLMRPRGAARHTFQVEYLQIYDEVLQRWVDLLSTTQLHDWAQLYVFQHDSPSERDLQAQLPSTRPLRSLPSKNESERMWQLFQDIDVNGNGFIERDELQRIFSVLGLFEFSELQVDDFFVKADSNRDGVLSYAELAKFALTCPHVSEALHMAGTEYLQAVKAKDHEQAHQLQRQTPQKDAAEARYQYLSGRRDVQVLQRGGGAERAVLERNRELAQMKTVFMATYGSEPASPGASPGRSVGSDVGGGGGMVVAHGYAKSRKYPRPVSSPRHTSASPRRGARD